MHFREAQATCFRVAATRRLLKNVIALGIHLTTSQGPPSTRLARHQVSWRVLDLRCLDSTARKLLGLHMTLGGPCGKVERKTFAQP